MSDSALTDKARLTALAVGTAKGLLALFFHGLIHGGLLDLSSAKWQLLTVLFLALLAGFGTARITRSRLEGIAGRLGIRAGLCCALAAGAAINLIATLNALSAGTAALESALKARMWLALVVSLAAILPAVLCGFVGGLFGSHLKTAKSAADLPSNEPKQISWLRWATLGVMSASLLGLLAPLVFLGRSPKVDPPAITVSHNAPPPFQYEPPPGIESAKIGEIQPDITKVIEGIKSDSPVSLSADGRLLAYCDTSSGSLAIGVYDLNHFQKIASIQLPAYPQEPLVWSPDQKSLACTIGNGSDRQIWILRVADAKSIALPRPPGRDTPGGELFWWQQHELVFFPTDEAPLVFDLAKLVLKPIDESPFFTQLDASAKRQWLEGPRTSLPSQKAWKLDVRTVIRSVTPPPRRRPETDWELFGDSICAMSHPDLPLSYGFDSLVVNDGSKLLCAADGSKLIRLGNGQAEVTFMKKAEAPALHFEVSMPLADDAIKVTAWKQHVADGELCVLVCAPLINPLNHQVVGPDYQQVRGIAQLVEWKGRNAIFVMQTYSRPILSTDIATTLHAWVDGHKTIWKESAINDWWKAIQPLARALPEKLADLYMPTLLALNADSSPLVVVKAPERHRPAPKTQAPTAALIPSPLSQSPFSMLGSGSNSNLFPQGNPSVPAISEPARVTEAAVKEFIAAHHTKASQGDVSGMVADYDQIVDFLDKGKISKDMILAEETAHRQKWIKSSEKILGQVLAFSDAGLWRAIYTIEFYNENAAGDWHRGQADLTVTMASNIGRLMIIAQKAKVHDMVDSKTMGKPSAANTTGQRNVSITVPKPCYVCVTKAGDYAGLEFIDQISFVNGITWHRTYRELSGNGKVVNTCRAIYEGNGGVSADRRSSSIYVGSQGWARSLGTPEFVRACEKSAASLVGVQFHFQFNSEGIVEDHGLVFHLHK
jgi:hypothetical protein